MGGFKSFLVLLWRGLKSSEGGTIVMKGEESGANSCLSLGMEEV